MTWALCLNCGGLKFGAFCPCPECQVASTGDLDLDILFSDHHFTRATLGALGEIIQQIRAASDDDRERFWTFIKYVADNYPEVFTLHLQDKYEDRVTTLLSSLCLPTIELERSHPPQSFPDGSKETRRQRFQSSPSNGSGSSLPRALGPSQQGQSWLDGSGPFIWLSLNSDAMWAARLETALEDALTKGDHIAEGWSLLAKGDAHLELLEARRAVDCYEQSLAIARENGNRLLEEASLSGLGNAHFLLLGPLQAIDYHEQALGIAREADDRGSEGIHLGNLGAVYLHLGETSRAIDLHERALEIARETRNRVLEVNQLGNLGTAFRHSGAVDRAVKHHEEALAIAREFGDRRHEGEWLGCLGNDCLVQSDFEQANRYFEQALDIAREAGDRENEARWLGGMGNALLFSVRDYQIRRVRLRDLPRLFRLSRTVRRAMPLFEQAADIAYQAGDRRGEACWLGNLGSAYHRLGRMRQAIPYYEDALAIAREIGDRPNEAGWLWNLGNAYAALREPVRAQAYYRQALAVSESMDLPIVERIRRALEERSE